MAEELKLGLIGVDTSHVIAFTQILNDPKHPRFIPGARVVAAYPSYSPDVPLSASRWEEYMKRLRDEFGLKITRSIPELCDQVDGVLIQSVDGRRHLPEFREVIPSMKPCFIDKPMTASLEDAKEILRLAKESGIRVFSSSSLRLVPEVQEVVNDPEKFGEVEQVYSFSPAALEPTNPGLFWYGVHGVEILYTLMGAGCRSLRCFSDDRSDIVVAEWSDGRRATLVGTRMSRHDYGAVVHASKKTQAFVCNTKDIYVPLVQSIVAFFKGAKPPVPLETSVEMMAFMDAALRSKGEPVEVKI